jgi:hypothetical protein
MSKLSNKRTRQSALKRWKTFNEKEILDEFYNLDSNWSRKTINYVAKIVKLTEEQIYKWGYEKKRKTTDDQQKSSDIIKSRVGASSTNTACIDYNKLVDELSPNGELTVEKLTKQEKKVYDALKTRIMKKEKCIKEMSELDQILYERLPTESKDCMLKSTKRKTSISEESVSSQNFPTFMTRANSELTSISPKKRDIKLVDKEISNIAGQSQYVNSCLLTEIPEISNEFDPNVSFDELSRMPDFSMLDETLSFFGF